jgi:hypothetical protein
MRQLRRFSVTKISAFIFLLAFAGGMAANAADELAKEQYYTAHNMWYERSWKIPSINYQKGSMLPAGTLVSGIYVKKSPLSSFIKFTAEGQEYTIYMGRFHGGRDIYDLKERMFTTKSFAVLTRGMTDREKQCIKKGEVKEGLSKEAVIIICGYPPEHETPRLEKSIWKFWTGRFDTFVVTFDENHRVKVIIKN